MRNRWYVAVDDELTPVCARAICETLFAVGRADLDLQGDADKALGPFVTPAAARYHPFSSAELRFVTAATLAVVAASRSGSDRGGVSLRRQRLGNQPRRAVIARRVDAVWLQSPTQDYLHRYSAARPWPARRP